VASHSVPVPFCPNHPQPVLLIGYAVRVVLQYMTPTHGKEVLYASIWCLQSSVTRGACVAQELATRSCLRLLVVCAAAAAAAASAAAALCRCHHATYHRCSCYFFSSSLALAHSLRSRVEGECIILTRHPTTGVACCCRRAALPCTAQCKCGHEHMVIQHAACCEG
jgi:hypothetical protein